MLLEIIVCILAYVIGSISGAIVICRWIGLPDPRTQGSKNPGATNVLRLGSKKAAIATLLFDALKGAIPVFIAIRINPLPIFVGSVMLAVFLGHLYPIFFKFKGGKGVATALGVLTALSWPLGVLLIITWGSIVFLFDISSVGALGATLLAPVYTVWLLNIHFAIPVLCMSILIFWRHRENIKRLLHGKEPTIRKKSS